MKTEKEIREKIKLLNKAIEEEINKERKKSYSNDLVVLEWVLNEIPLNTISLKEK